MKNHLSIEELDAFMEGNMPEDKMAKAKEHLAACGECRMQCEILKDTRNYLETVEPVSGLITKRVVESLSKTKRKTKRKPSVLKPVLSFLMVLAFMGLSFYFGMKYDSLQNRTAGPLNADETPGLTQQDINAVPEISQPAVTSAGEQSAEQNKNVTLILYFPNAYADSVVPEERQIEVKNGANLEKIIFTELQKGSLDNEKGSVIPEGTELLSVETREGICYLDLSNEFVDNNPGGSAFEQVLIHSVVNSLTELPHVEKVQFLINGEKREVYSHLIFDEPFERNEEFIRTPENTSEAIEAKIRELGEKTLKAMRDLDMETLSKLIHPDKKLRFSPYTYVDLDKDMVFSPDEIKLAMESDTVYTWGVYDGSGEPIDLSFKDYLSQFVYDNDFLNAEVVGYNRSIGEGNTTNNIFEVYPDGIVIEYHFPGFDPELNGIDWVSLKLVFEQKDGNWFLVGVVHDQWTI